MTLTEEEKQRVAARVAAFETATGVEPARLWQHGNNRSATARSLGIDRGNFRRLLKKPGLG